MGADFTEQRAEGRNAREAYAVAVADAQYQYGHQEGYSGAINSKESGFVLVALPPRMTYAKLSSLLDEYDMVKYDVRDAADDVKSWRPGGFFNPTGTKRGWKGNLRKAEMRLKKARAAAQRLETKVPSTLNIDSLSETYHDKWGQPLCVELSTREAKPSKRGRRVYVFFGYAPC